MLWCINYTVELRNGFSYFLFYNGSSQESFRVPSKLVTPITVREAEQCVCAALGLVWQSALSSHLCLTIPQT